MATKPKRPITEAQRKARRKYNAKPSSIKQRDNNNKARRLMEKKGKVHKGDGKDVAHLNNNTFDENPKNLAVQSRHKNRSFKRKPNSKRKYG